MIDYENLPPIELPLAEFKKLEDRSMCIGDDRVPLKRFRVNLRFFSPPSCEPEWIIGTFYEDAECRREDEEIAREFGGRAGDALLSRQYWIKIRWERVVFTDGEAPTQGLADQQQQLTRFERLKAEYLP